MTNFGNGNGFPESAISLLWNFLIIEGLGLGYRLMGAGSGWAIFARSSGTAHHMHRLNDTSGQGTGRGTGTCT